MKQRTWLWIGITLAVVVLLGVARSNGPAKDIPSGTGYSAWELCTRAFHSGERFDDTRERFLEPKVRELPYIWSLDVRPGEAVTVSTVLPTLAHPRTAIFREGLGCTLVPPGTTEAELRAQPFTPAPEPPPDGRPWPLGEGAVEPSASQAIIQKHADALFAEETEDPAKKKNTTALLVAQGGKLVYERYGHGYTRDQVQLGWSMTKTVTALIAGLFEKKGALAIDAKVGLPAWQGTEKESITWRQLLNMAPGLAWFEGYGGASDATEMLFSSADQGAWAAGRPMTSKPGTVFNYSTGFTNIAMLRLRQLAGGTHQQIYDVYQRELFAPLGIRRGVIEPDASGTPVGGARGMLRPVDWLRLGQLVANGGTWNGAAILSPDYVKFLTAASPADAGYGAFIWRGASNLVPAALHGKLPDDLVWFAGHLGQFTIVVPSKNLVVLRMGVSLGGTMDFDLARDQAFDLVQELSRLGG